MSTKISVRLSDSVLQAVDEAAKREGRNRSQQIEWVLRSSLAGKEIEDWSKNTIAEAAGHVATEAEAIAKWGPKESGAKMCEKHNQPQATCTGASCRIERADRERRML